MGNKSIIRLSPDPEGFGETPDELDATDFSSDVPVQHTHSDYEDDEIGLYVGLWDTETMVEAGGLYACDEFMWLIASGARPQHKVCYKDSTGRFFSGTWASEAFESRQRPFPYNGFAYVYDGSITLTDANGAAREFTAGDAFFIPEGVECDAAVASSVRLYFTVIKSLCATWQES